MPTEEEIAELEKSLFSGAGADEGAEGEAAVEPKDGEAAVDDGAVEKPAEKPADKAAKPAAKAADAAADDAGEETTDKAAEKPPTNADFAKMRRDMAAKDKQIKDLLEKQGKPATQAAVDKAVDKQAAKTDDPEPDAKTDPLGHAQWQIRQLTGAVNSLKSEVEKGRAPDPELEEIKRDRLYDEADKEMETKYLSEMRRNTPDTDARIKHVGQMIYAGYRSTDPSLSHAALLKKTRIHLLSWAGRLEKEGKNPAQEMYDMAESHYGYKAPDPTPDPLPKPDAKAKPDLKKIDASRKKSVTPANSGGKSGKGGKNVEDLSLADIESMDEGELKDLVENAA